MQIRPIDGNALAEEFTRIGALNAEFFAEQARKAPVIPAGVLQCGGYIMFRGFMKIRTERNALLNRNVFGTWLYMPDEDQWLCDDGRVFTPDRCEMVVPNDDHA